MSDVFQQHGAFSWSELMTDDPVQGVAFYTQVIGWEVEEMAMPEGIYYILKAGGKPVAGVMGKPKGFETIPNHWGTYITVNNVDETLERAKAAGGSMVHEPKNIPGVGRISAIRDPDGAIVSIITYEKKEC